MERVDAVARVVGRAGRVLQLVARRVLPLDTNPVDGSWRHVTKIDPEHAKPVSAAFPRYLQYTDGISVGGSADVTSKNTCETFELLDRVSTPVFHEPSAASHVNEATRDHAAFLAIPEVLNGDSDALVGTLGEGTEYIKEVLVPSVLDDAIPSWVGSGVKDRLVSVTTSWLLADAVFEAYIIQNPDSAAAREANVGPDDVLDPIGAKRRALAAEHHLESEVVYIEYSGTYGGEEGASVVAAVSDAVDWPRVWYGGGIESREQATEMLDAGADTIVVGNCFHDVATEELEIYADARDALGDDATQRDVEHYVMDSVDIDESAAARYLATIPDVDDPAWTATECLVSAITFRLTVDQLVRDADHAGVETKSDLDGFMSLQSFDSDVERWLAEAAIATAHDIPGEYAPIHHLRLTDE